MPWLLVAFGVSVFRPTPKGGKVDWFGTKERVQRLGGVFFLIGVLCGSAACLPNSSQARNTAASVDGCERATETGVTKIRETYAICTLANGPEVLGRSDVRATYDGLPPGRSLNVTESFLRTAERWPYVDVRGPGANISPNMPNPRRAAYLMHAADPAFDGPLLFVAPAQVEHSLGTVAAGQTPPDIWTVTGGPFAPTVYGRIQTGAGEIVDFVAHPTEAGTAVFGETQRIELSQMISRHFGGT